MDRSHNQETHFGLVQSTGIRYFQVSELATENSVNDFDVIDVEDFMAFTYLKKLDNICILSSWKFILGITFIDFVGRDQLSQIVFIVKNILLNFLWFLKSDPYLGIMNEKQLDNQ